MHKLFPSDTQLNDHKITAYQTDERQHIFCFSAFLLLLFLEQGSHYILKLPPKLQVTNQLRNKTP